MFWIRAFLTIFMLAAFTVFAKEPDGKKRQSADDRGVKLTQKNGDTRRRIALVIGNSRYVSSPLKNPVNDARSMAAALRRLGFEVEELKDLGYNDMNEALENFGNRLKPGGVGLFYYAGHGMQVDGANYLIPVDARIKAENEVRYKTVDAGLVLAKMEQARSDVNIVILDACRDNPFSRSFRSSSRGLASMDAPYGTFIAYATSPGKTAADGDGQNGIYTEELVKVLETPGLPIEQVFKRTLKTVREKSGSQQLPWVASNLEGEFWFVPPSALTDLQPTPIVDRSPFRDSTTGMEFVLVKGGCFRMGDITGDGEGDEKPVHEVCVDDFAMGKYEVTVGQFRAFVDATGYRSDAERNSGGKNGCYAYEADKDPVWENRGWGNWKQPNKYLDNEDRHPVSCVSWEDTQAFVSWLNARSSVIYRLPTEAEWEYAARGGTTARNYWGDGKDDACRFANVADQAYREGATTQIIKHNCRDGYQYVAPVGQYLPNDYGLYDMMGNLWEWCSDWYAKDYYGSSPRNNPHGPAMGADHVIRGGGWSRGPANIRASVRYNVSLFFRSAGVGFRLVVPVK